MSGNSLELSDGNLPEIEELFDEDEEDLNVDAWRDMMFVQLGPYQVEYDHATKELTIVGKIDINVDCIDADSAITELFDNRTVILRPSGE